MYMINWRISKFALFALVGTLLVTTFVLSTTRTFAFANAWRFTRAHAILRHTPSGFATLHWERRTEKLTVTIQLSGLAANSTHPAHIHLGDCDDNGPIVYPLNNVISNAAGNASITTVISEVEHGIPASSWYVNVHNGPGLSTPAQFDPIACGNIFNPNSSTRENQTVRVFLGVTTAPNQVSFGFATLRISDHELIVRIVVRNLVPGSMHAAHIHVGSCERQLPGNVLFPITTVVGGANGIGVSVTVIKGVSFIPASGWYVNIHLTTNLTTQTGFDPIACGDVVV